jgi:hypothetical protein
LGNFEMAIIATKNVAQEKAETPHSMTSAAQATGRREEGARRQFAHSLLRGGRRHPVYQIEPTLYTVEPSINIVEPLLKGSVIQFGARDLAPERAKAGYDLVEFAIDAVEALVEPRETSAQKVEDVASFAHV